MTHIVKLRRSDRPPKQRTKRVNSEHLAALRSALERSTDRTQRLWTDDKVLRAADLWKAKEVFDKKPMSADAFLNWATKNQPRNT